MPEQPPPPPSNYTGVRTDAGARKIVERIDLWRAETSEVAKRLATLEARQENAITMRQTMAASVILLGLAGGFGVFFLSRAEAAARDAGVAAEQKADQALSRQADLERFVKQDLRELKGELKSDMADIKAEVRNTTKAVERTVPRRRVAPPDAGASHPVERNRVGP